MLGISFSLFNNIVFEPRNRGIHKFALIEEVEAQHGYQLAALTVRNCIHSVSPGEATVFYGDLEIYRDNEALEKLGHSSLGVDAFYFAGIGDTGSCSVFIDRNYRDGKISILKSLGMGEVESRYCTIKNQLSSDELRTIFSLLERNDPTRIALNKDDELNLVLDALSQNQNYRAISL